MRHTAANVNRLLGTPAFTFRRRSDKCLVADRYKQINSTTLEIRKSGSGLSSPRVKITFDLFQVVVGDTKEQATILTQEKAKISLSEEKNRLSAEVSRAISLSPPKESLHLPLTVKNKDKTSGNKLRAVFFSFSFPYPFLFVL